jgi:hypothetical protein
MSKKSKKVAEKKALTPIKKLTPIAKADESMKAKQTAAIAELKAKSKDAAPIEAPVVAAPVRPEMPADFCMEKADWDGAGVCYDAGSNNCGTCTKDFPETVAVCIERMKFLGGTVKTAKTKKAGTAKARVAKNGAKPQCLVIDDLLRASTAMADMIASFAAIAYAGDAKAAEGRINRHLKSIRVGEYVRSAVMKEFIAYLAVAAPAAPAA